MPSTAVEPTFLGTPETPASTQIPEAILTRMGTENKLPSCSWKEVMYSENPYPQDTAGHNTGNQNTKAFSSHIIALALGKETVHSNTLPKSIA